MPALHLPFVCATTPQLPITGLHFPGGHLCGQGRTPKPGDFLWYPLTYSQLARLCHQSVVEETAPSLPPAISLGNLSSTQRGTGTNQPAHCPSRHVSRASIHPTKSVSLAAQPLSCSPGASLSLALVTGISSTSLRPGKGVNHLLSEPYSFSKDKQSVGSHPVLLSSLPVRLGGKGR